MPAVSESILVHARLLNWKSSQNSVQKLGRHLPFGPRENSRKVPTFRGAATLSSKRQLSSWQTRENKLPLISNSSQSKRHKISLTLARPFSHSSRGDKPKYFSHPIGLYPTQPKPIQSAIGTWTAAILIGAISGSVYFFTARPKHSGKPDIDHPCDQVQQSEARDNSSSTHPADMGETSQPGHVENLSPEQEEKLQQLWIATLQVFGVLDTEQAKALNSAVNGTIVPVLSKQSVPASEQAKKKKRGWFGKKTESENTPAVSSDDKYNLAAKFAHALENASPEVIRSSFWSMLKHDNPDMLLLRFLRARKWDVEKALVMMISTFHWRSVEMHVDDEILVNGEEAMLLDSTSDDPIKKKRATDFLDQIRTGKSFLHGVDKLGRPMCFIRSRLHHAGDQDESSLERYTIYVIEIARFVVQPPAETACLVFDMTDFSLANMDYTPVKFMINCFEANYPESLGVILIHKAPWVFQGIWKIIKGLLDPVVAGKVNFTNSNADMEAFIDKSRIIKELGGEEDWEMKYIEPVIGENDLMKDVETRNKIQSERDAIGKEYEKATIAWIENKASEEVRKKRGDLEISLEQNYWKLDPYVRARSFYDRAGMIKPEGIIEFYPTATKDSTAPETAVPGTSAVAAAPPAAAAKVATVETTSDDID